MTEGHTLCILESALLNLTLFIFVRICKEFETMKEKALNPPVATEDMTEMILYISHAKTEGIEELNNKIFVSS